MTQTSERLERIEDGVRENTDVLAEVRVTLARIDQRNVGADAEHADHEQRLRALERWRWSMPAASGASAVAAVSSFLAIVMHH